MAKILLSTIVGAPSRWFREQRAGVRGVGGSLLSLLALSAFTGTATAQMTSFTAPASLTGAASLARPINEPLNATPSFEPVLHMPAGQLALSAQSNIGANIGANGAGGANGASSARAQLTNAGSLALPVIAPAWRAAAGRMLEADALDPNAMRPSPYACEAASAFQDPAKAPAVPATEEDCVKKIKAEGDAVKPEVIHQLANFKTRTAMQSLIDLYETLGTIFMKREIVRSLTKFDGVADAEQPALKKLMDVATEAKDVELRMAAIDSLGDCGVHGKDFLVLIIESAAEDSLRERAMTAHLRLHDKADLEWYKQIYKPKDEGAGKPKKPVKKDLRKQQKKPEPAKKPEPKKGDKPDGKGDGKGDGKDDGKDDEGDDAVNKKGHMLPVLRQMAFEALLTNMTPDELVEATRDEVWKIRFEGIEELDRRQDAKIGDLAAKTLDKANLGDTAHQELRGQEMSTVRALCARIVARIQGAKAAADFIKKGTSIETPAELRNELADIVGGFNDPATNKELIQELTGRGSPTDKLFFIRATKGLNDEKVSKGLEHLLLEKPDEKGGNDVIVAAIRAIGERKQKESVDKLAKMIGKGKERNAMRAALEAMSVLRTGDPAWIEELIGLTKSDDPELRSLALQALGDSKDKKAIEKLVAALSDENWSTRLAALDALERLKTKEAVGPIIERMGKEEGRMLQEFSLALWRLTGQSFQDNAPAWANWWKTAADKFEFLTPEQLNSVKSGEEDFRLRQTTRVEQKFFGIRIVSHRVIFIIDVSGSMVELINSEYEGKPNQQRMEVAKRELDRCIQGLDPSAFFNIITFSSDVSRWVDILTSANEKNRGEARTYVSKLLAAGGTNLYGAVKEAFKDKDVDTIFIMSDGEPSVGEVIDPLVIREHVKAWNEHRGVQISTISVGGQFQVLEWLATDSGGTYISID